MWRWHCSVPYPYMWRLLLTGFIVLQERLETEIAGPTTKIDVESLVTYKRSLERQNKAFAKQIKKLKKVIISPFFYTSCSTSVAPVGQCSSRPTISQAEALCFKIHINAPQSSWQAEVWKSEHIQRDSKRWTQLRTSVFTKLHMACEWST